MVIVERIVEPAQGATKFKRRFAWLPTRAGGGLIWLEFYEAMYAYIVINVLVVIDHEQVSIRYGEWRLVSTRLYNKHQRASIKLKRAS